MKIVTLGEIMLQLAPPGFQRFTQAHLLEATDGGGEVNVTVSLANYGYLDVSDPEGNLIHLLWLPKR